MQSPISVYQDSLIPKHYTPFYFCNYNKIYNAQIALTEQAITINLSPEKWIPSVTGGGLYRDYNLASIEFHWDSEHAIDDKKYPLEVQLVHYAKPFGSFENALNYKDGLAIFSTFFEHAKTENEALQQLIDSMPSDAMKIDRPVDLEGTMVPRNFLPYKIGKFYRYNGSMTRPCHDETAIWTLFCVPQYASQQQIERVTEKWNSVNKNKTKNCRDLQELNNRRVYASYV